MKKEYDVVKSWAEIIGLQCEDCGDEIEVCSKCHGEFYDNTPIKCVEIYSEDCDNKHYCDSCDVIL